MHHERSSASTAAYAECVFEEDEQARRDRERLAEEQRKDQENVDIIMQSGRLFVRNLPFAATEEELETFFATFGPVEQVRVKRHARCQPASQG